MIIPLGVMSISSFLKKNGHAIKIMDLNLYGKKSTEQLVEILLEEDAEMYGFSIAAGTLHMALQLAQIIKERHPDKKILLGGPQATLTHYNLMTKFPFIDIISRGEGEETILELIEAFENKRDLHQVEGITWRDGEKIIVNVERPLICDLDSLELPDYSAYTKGELNKLSIPIEVGRGCPFACAFCSSSVLWKRKFRVKSVDRIMREMKFIIDSYQIKMFYFRHDQIIMDKVWLKELCRNLKNLDDNVLWQCSARIDTVNKELLEMMKDCGCTGIEFGIESLSEHIQNQVNKKLKKDTIIKNLNIVIHTGINPVLFFMCGFPDETNEDLAETLDGILQILFSCEQTTFFQLRSLQPFPNTAVREENKDRLKFYPERLTNNRLTTYTQAQIDLAKENSDLFPEFYYVENKYGIPFDYFLFIEKVYNSLIRFMNTHFFLVFKYILHKCNCSYKKLFEILGEYIDLHSIDKMGKEEFVNTIRSILENESMAIRDIYEYERVMYSIQDSYHDVERIESFSMERKVRKNPNLKIMRFQTNIIENLNKIKINAFEGIEDTKANEDSILLIQAVNKNNIVSLKINQQLADFIEELEHEKSIAEILREHEGIESDMKVLLGREVII